MILHKEGDTVGKKKGSKKKGTKKGGKKEGR